jgi:hypothetical protein
MTTPKLGTIKSHLSNTSNPHSVTAAQIGLTGPMDYKGGITLAADFPTTAAVGTGDTYTISAAVTDNDATKTNTGQSFNVGEEIAWNGTNWTVLGSVYPDISASNAAVNMKTPAANVVTLPGLATQNVQITEAIFRCTAATALNGDCTVTIGNTVGGTQIMAAQVLTGLNTVGETFRINMVGVFPAMPGNDVLDVSVTVGDTGTSGTMTVTLVGKVI